jgi:hypothetical protein
MSKVLKVTLFVVNKSYFVPFYLGFVPFIETAYSCYWHKMDYIFL